MNPDIVSLLAGEDKTSLMKFLPLFRWLDPQVMMEMLHGIQPKRLEAGETLHPSSLDDLVVVGTGLLVVNSSVSRDGKDYHSFTQLRTAAVLSAGPLRTELLKTGPHATVPTAQQLHDRMTDANSVVITAQEPSWLLVLPADRVRSLFNELRSKKLQNPPSKKAMAFRPETGADLARTIACLEWIDRGPDASLMAPIQRLALASTAEVRNVYKGDELQRVGEIPEAVYVVGPATLLELSLGGATHTWLQTGGMFAYMSWIREESTYTVRAERDGWVLAWKPRGAVRKFASPGPLDHGSWFTNFCADRHQTYKESGDILAALRHDPLLTGVPNHILLPLLEGASRVQWRVGAPPPVPVSTLPGLCVITQGEVVGYRTLAGEQHGSVAMLRCEPMSVHRGRLECQKHGDKVLMQALGSGEVARYLQGGDPEASVALNRWAARVPSQGVFMPAWRVKLAIQTEHAATAKEYTDKLVQNDLSKGVLDGLDAGAGTFKDDLNVVWVCRSEGDGLDPRISDDDAPTSASSDVRLLMDLAGNIASQFDESSLLVRLMPTSADHPDGSVVERIGSPADGPHYLHLHLHVDPDDALSAVATLLTKRTHYANVFLWRSPDFALDDQPVAAAADTIMYMNRLPNMPFARVYQHTTPFQVANLVRCGPNSWLPPATVRLHGLLEDDPPNTGFAGYNQVLGRWARSITHRRVGVALGGGGAWGWAHVALLWGMHAHGVPVDLVSGASFGSVAGGIFAVGGFRALRWALDHDKQIQTAVNRSMLLGSPIETLVDDLPDSLKAWATDAKIPNADTYLRNLQTLNHGSNPLRLQHTPIPFYPVSTDLVAGSEAPIQFGTVGQGVRSSGALPPVFPVTRNNGSTLADGGLSRNVPANVLQLEGASIIVASNIVPPPFLREPAAVRQGLRAKLRDLNPVRRGISTILGFQTLFNQAGAVDTGLAPIIFQAEWAGTMFFQIDKGWDIVGDTRSNREFWQAMAGLVGRWEQVRKPRRGSTPIQICSESAP